MTNVAEAALSDDERRLVERIVEELRAELGERLRAVWLYGSRARGEAPGPDSDIDLLAIVEDGEDVSSPVWGIGERASVELGMGGVAVSVLTGELSWLAGRRAIEAFYIQEVDRDKIVLFGDELDDVQTAVGGTEPTRGLDQGDGRGTTTGMSPRSNEYLDRAREYLAAAQRALDGEFPAPAISTAYTSMLNAARAALSEEDLFARTHKGTWHLFLQSFVLEGRFDAMLRTKAADSQELREDVDHKAKAYPLAKAREIVALAETFLAEVERMLDVA